MATAQPDGSLILKTSVDDKGIKTGLNNIKSLTDKLSGAFNKMGVSVDSALSKGDTKTAQLIKNYQAANAQVEAHQAKVAALVAELEKLNLIQGIQKAQNDINALIQQLDELQMQASKDAEGNPIFSEAEQAQFDEINAKLDVLEPKLAEARQKAQELGIDLKEAMGADTQAQIENVSQKLQQEEKHLEDVSAKALIAGEKLQQGMNEGTQGANEFGKSITGIGNRIMRMAKTALFFSVFRRMFTNLRQEIGNVLMSNEQFRNSLAQLQAAFWTVAAPIYQYVIPALVTLVNWITRAITAIAQFIGFLTGKSLSAMTASGKALKQQADAYKSVGSGAGKAAKGMKAATKEAEKQLAAFDDLTILSENKADADSGESGSAGKSGDGGVGNGEVLEWDTANLDQISEKMQGIATLVGLIGAALLAWKIYEFVSTLEEGGEAAKLLQGKLKTVSGTLLMIAGAFLLIKGYSDAWVNGVDWLNFAEIIGGLAMVIGGVALAVSPVAAAFVAIGAGIAVVVLGIKDFIANGPSLQNILLIIIGLLAIFAATLYIANLPIALIVTAIVALVAVFVILWNKSEGFRNFWINLWDKIKTAAVKVWKVIKTKAVEAWELIKENWGKAVQWFKDIWDGIKDAWANVKEWFSTLFANAKEGIEEAWENVVSWFQNVWDDIKLVFAVVKDVLSGNFSDAWEKIKEIWNNVKDWFQERWDNIKEVFSVVEDVLGGFFSDALDKIKEIWGNIKDWFQERWDDITGVFDTIDTWFKDKFDDVWENIKNAFNGFKEFFQNLWNTVKDTFTDFGSKIGTAIGDAVKSGINSSIKLIENTINKAIGLINGAIGLINNIPGVNVGKIANVTLPRLAYGAVIPPNNPYLAVVGDQKQGLNIEAPLDTIVEAFNIALRSNNYNSNNTVILEVDGREFGRAVIEQGNRENRRVGTRLVIT